MKVLLLALVAIALSAQVQPTGPFRPSGPAPTLAPTTPQKGPNFLPSRAAIIDAAGLIDGASGTLSNCVHVDGSSGPCGSGGGGAGSGTVDSGLVNQLTCYPGSSTEVGGCSNVFWNGSLWAVGAAIGADSTVTLASFTDSTSTALTTITTKGSFVVNAGSFPNSSLESRNARFDAIRGEISCPSGATATGACVGVSGYAISYSTSFGSIGGYFAGLVGASSPFAFALNPIVVDANSINGGTSFPVNFLNNTEFDTRVENAGTNNAIGAWSVFNGSLFSPPVAQAFTSDLINNGGNAYAANWNQGFVCNSGSVSGSCIFAGATVRKNTGTVNVNSAGTLVSYTGGGESFRLSSAGQQININGSLYTIASIPTAGTLTTTIPVATGGIALTGVAYYMVGPSAQIELESFNNGAASDVTITNTIQGNMQFAVQTGNAYQDFIGSNMIWSLNSGGSAVLNTLGLAGGVTGQLVLENGNSGGAGATVRNIGAMTAYNFNLPPTAGTPGQALVSNGGVNSAMSWITPTGTGSFFMTASNATFTAGDIPFMGMNGNASDSGILAANIMVNPNPQLGTFPRAISALTETWTVGAGGVTINTLVMLDSSNPPKIIAASGFGAYGIALATVAAAGTVQVARYGTALLIADTGGVAAGNLITPGTGTTYYGKDSGLPTAALISFQTRIVGQALTSASSGNTFTIELMPNHNGALGPASTLSIDTGGSSIGNETVLNFVSGSGITQSCSDNPGVSITCTPDINTAYVPTNAGVQATQYSSCISSGDTGAAYTCGMTPALTGYTQNMVVNFIPDAYSIANCTVNIQGMGPIALQKTATGASFTITGATNASPIVVTVSAIGALANGDVISVAGVGGNTAANGTQTVGSISGSTFHLVGSAGNGAYTSGGTAYYAPPVACAANDLVPGVPYLLKGFGSPVTAFIYTP